MKQNYYRVDREFWNSKEDKWIGDMGWTFDEFQETYPASDYKSFEEFADLVKEGCLNDAHEYEEEGLIPCYLIYAQETIMEEPTYIRCYLPVSSECMADWMGIKSKPSTYYVS